MAINTLWWYWPLKFNNIAYFLVSQTIRQLCSMKKLHLCLGTMLFLATVKADAGELGNTSFDFQFRSLFHIQYVDLHTNKLGSFGLAGWAIFSDVTAKNNETASFHVLGPLWQYGKKGSWFEVMGGLRRNEDGYNDPVVDLRLLDRTFSRINLMAELAYFPREERRRLYTWMAADTPIPLGRYQMRLGIESENIFSYSGQRDSWGIGPRLVFPIPLQKISPALSSSLAVAYQHRNDQDFLRCYLGLTCKLGR